MGDPEGFIPRNYQVELMKIALEQNTIIFLPTGSGKTFIALMVLKQMSESLLKSYGNGGKITIILVNTVALVDQHASYIHDHTNFEVGKYTGEMNLDFWPRCKWYDEYEKFQVLIMTSQILVNLVNNNYIDLNKVNLLIFDECHRGVNDQPMRQLMKHFQCLTDPPRVLGLTATLLNGNCKPSRVIEEVETLETTYHSKVATVEELKVVVGFSTNPIESLTPFHVHNPTPAENFVLNLLEETVGVLKKVKFEPVTVPIAMKDLQPLDVNQGTKKLCNLINDLIYHIKTMGIYGGYKACLAHIIQIERIKKHCDDLKLLTILNCVQTTFTFVNQKLKDAMQHLDEKDAIFNCSSDQIIKLIHILKEYETKSKEDLCCIIFTQRRFTAKVIYHILNALSKCHPDYSHIKANFMVGMNCNPYSDTRENMYVHKQSKQVLDSFSREELNILVSSNVLEEGVDIKKCTLVIKYDHPTDYRSYIQSKGRARHKESLYYMMVDYDNLNKFLQRYEEYRMVEGILNNYLIGKNDERSEPSQDDIEAMYNEDELPPYYVDGKGSAQVNMRSAIPLLCQYCQSLPGDMYTSHAPDWFLKKIPDVPNKCQIVILLPTICRILDMIEGPRMNNVKLAKRAAALKACELLHKAGELDDHLLPKKNIIKPEDVSFLFSHYPTDVDKSASTLKTKRLHKKLIPKIIREQIQPFSSVYLHIINLEPAFNKHTEDISHLTLTDSYASSLCYGLITKNPLPILCDFPIYVTLGTMYVSLKVNQSTVTITDKDLHDIKQFHLEVLDNVLNILQNFVAFDNGDNPEMMILVPVNKQAKNIDWNVLRPHIQIHQVIEMNNEEKMSLEVSQETYLRKIVSPWYRRDPATYVVTEVCLNKSADSPFPNEDYGTFKDYFKSRHNIELRNPGLPLLLVKGLSKNLNVTKPKGKAAAKRKHDKMYNELEEYLPPELVVKQDFPSSLWIQANFLPTILSRISFMLQLEELRCRIAREKPGLGQEIALTRKPLELDEYLLDYEAYTEEESNIELPNPNCTVPSLLHSSKNFNHDFADKQLESQYPWKNIEEPKDIERDLEVNILDIEHYETFIGRRCGESRELKNASPKKSKNLALTYYKDFVPVKIEMLETPFTNKGPELCEFYRALTAAKANEIVNLERLETLGDSFLKLLTTLYIYLRFPTYDEGRATTLKGRMVSNRNLYYLAEQKNINGILKFKELCPKSQWLPPALAVPKEMQKRLDNKELSINALFGLGISFEEQVSGILNEETIEDILSDECPLTDTEDTVYDTMASFVKGQCIGDKFVADSVESLLGAFFKDCGFTGGIKFIEWIGLIPESEHIAYRLKEPPSNPFLNTDNCENKIRIHLPLRQEIEKIIGYEFKNKGFLLQALTHSSYTPNRATLSYEKLEFLGDAVLDFLITCHIYETCGNLDPGKLTDLRSALVNNNTFASLVVRLGLQKYILLANMKLQKLIDKFVNFMEQKNFIIDDEVMILLQEDEIQMAESVDVPKILGDIFEAIAGAIYLDSNNDLKTVWNVFYKIMWKEIDLFSRNVPINVVRKLNEWTTAHPVFGKQIQTSSNRSMMPLKIMVNGMPVVVHGFGTNKSMAKKAAAKLALQLLVDRK